MLRFLISLEISFVWGDNYEFIWILLRVAIQFDQHHLLKILPFFYSVYFCLLNQKLDDQKYVNFCLVLQFNLIYLRVCFYSKYHAVFIIMAL